MEVFDTYINYSPFYASDESGQMVEHTLAFEHNLLSHLMDPTSVNESPTSQKCALLRTLFPGTRTILTLKEFQAAP